MKNFLVWIFHAIMSLFRRTRAAGHATKLSLWDRMRLARAFRRYKARMGEIQGLGRRRRSYLPGRSGARPHYNWPCTRCREFGRVCPRTTYA